MAGKGGARPGAGRKPKAIKFETQIQRAEGMIADRLPWVVDKLFELGEGVLVEEAGLTGHTVYQKPPDRDALKYLADRIMGKPTERKEHSFDKPLEEMTEDELRAIRDS
jgi:hypothetical protein